MATTAYETILLVRLDGVGLVTLNRPERRNAYTARMGIELHEAFAELEADEAVRAIVVTGAGRDFCVGADLARGGGHIQKQPRRRTRDHRPAATRRSAATLGNGNADHRRHQRVGRGRRHHAAETDRDAAHALEGETFWWTGRQADAGEGITAFLEKRAPSWKLSKHARPPSWERSK